MSTKMNNRSCPCFVTLPFLHSPKVYVLFSFFCVLCCTHQLFSQATPCNGVRWSDGDDAPGSNTGGVVACGSAANTERLGGNSQLQTYDSTNPNNFPLGNRSCFDVDQGPDGPRENIAEPANGTDVLWFQFDLRPNVGTFEFQIGSSNGTRGEIVWELYYSTDPSYDGLGGDCNNLAFVDCGNEFSGWADFTFESPCFAEPTNFYMAVYPKPGTNSSLNIINFKARFGCGGSGDCGIFAGNCKEEGNGDAGSSPEISCNGDQYEVAIPTFGVNGLFSVSDLGGNVTNLTPSTMNFGSINTNGNITDTVRFNIPYGESYEILIEGTGNCNKSLTLTGDTPDRTCTLINEATICLGESITLSPASSASSLDGGADPIPTYNWSGTGFFTENIDGTLNVHEAGTYSLNVEWEDGCTLDCSGSPTAITMQSAVLDYGFPNDLDDGNGYDNHPAVDQDHSHSIWLDFKQYLGGTNTTDYSSLERFWRELSDDPLSMTFNPDGTASITGTVQNVNVPCVKLDVQVVLNNKMSWTDWVGYAGRQTSNDPPDILTTIDPTHLPIKDDYTNAPARSTQFWQQWDYYLIDEDQSRLTLVCDPGCTHPVCDPANGNPTTFKIKNLKDESGKQTYAFQYGTGANDKDSDPFGTSGWYQVCSLDENGVEDGRVNVRGDGNLTGQCSSGSSPTAVLEEFSVVQEGADAVVNIQLSDEAVYDRVLLERSVAGRPYEELVTLRDASTVVRSETNSFRDVGMGDQNVSYRVMVDVPNPMLDFFYSGSVSPSGILPLTVVDFQARASQTQGISLHWTLEDQRDLFQIEVEKKVNDESFVPIYTLFPEHHTEGHQAYSFLDTKTQIATHYYRLKFTDFDGTLQYSDIRAVKLEEITEEVKVYPNPVRDQLFLDSNLASGQVYQVQIVDQLGRSVLTRFLHSDTTTAQLDVSRLNAGAYWVLIQLPDGKRQQSQLLKW